MEEHLEHRSEFLVQLDQSIVLRFLFTSVLFRIEIRQLSREGRELVGAEVSLENWIFHTLGKIGDHRYTTGQILRLGGSHVEIVSNSADRPNHECEG